MEPHMEMKDAAVEATCTETGLTEGKHCLVCGYVITEQQVVPVKDHNTSKGICVDCTGKIIAADVSDTECEVLDFDCDDEYISLFGDLKDIANEFVPITLLLTERLLDGRSIDITLSDFGFTKFK